MNDIHRLLIERPQARGLTVPGMPIGSPGMEMGTTKEAFDTLLVFENGRTEVFKRHVSMLEKSSRRCVTDCAVRTAPAYDLILRLKDRRRGFNTAQHQWEHVLYSNRYQPCMTRNGHWNCTSLLFPANIKHAYNSMRYTPFD